MILSPFLGIISLLIKIETSGPIFFIQERMGIGENTFKLIKFRSMHYSKVRGKEDFTPGDGTRVTNLGKILRKTKIDEFPELINVLKGDMSLVGPRPEVPKYRSIYKGKFRPVLSMKPGLTDLASIKYRHEEELLAQSLDPGRLYEEQIFPDKLRLALEYKKHISLKNDLKIIFLTIKGICR